MHIFTRRHVLLQSCMFLFDTVVYMYCPAMMPCGVGEGSFGLLGDNRWNATSSFALSLTSLCFFRGVTVCYISHLVDISWVEERRRFLGLITSTFLTILCAVVWILTLSCWNNTCVQFSLTHMYIKCIYVFTRAIHKQSITVTIITIFSIPLFWFLSWFSCWWIVLQEPKREGDAILYTRCRFRGLRTF